MLAYTFTDIVITIFSSILVFFLWLIYYVYVNTITVPNTESVDILIKKNIRLTQNIFPIFVGLFILWFFIFNYVYINNFNNSLIFWDAIYISNNTINFFFLSTLILFCILSAVMLLKKQNISFNIEYILFVFLIIFAGYLLISSTNLFISIFFLEFIALLIFGKFTVSKTIFNLNKINSIKPSYLTQYSYGLFNSLFFQFWANFVSSVFLFFSLINMHYLCGTSNFFLLNFIFYVVNSTWYVSEYFLITSLTAFVTGLFIKLGLSPYQFFKIETYKGIPLFMVIVYTTVYLIVYIYFFIYLILYQLPIIKQFTGPYMLFFIIISLLYLISLLFDTKNFKAFLSYSTLITIVNLFIVVLVI